jgi:hypothetical protein
MTFNKSVYCLLTSGIMMLTLPGCDRNRDDNYQIPYDKEKAQVHIRPLSYAARLTADYRRGKIELSRQLKDPAYLDQRFNLPDAEMFNRDAIAALLNQKGVKGMRIYLGKDGDTIKFVIAGVDAKGNDITGKLTTTRMKTLSKSSENSSAVLLEAGQRCPTMCSVNSPLYKQ